MSEFPHQLVPAAGTGKILVCDDDLDTRSLVAHSLSAIGHQVVEAQDGVEAQDVFLRESLDVIVMDIMMPRLTGTEFVKWLRAEERDEFVPVLLLTALDEVEQQVEGFQIGADDYVTKPFNIRELHARVEALLRIKSLTQSLHKRNQEIKAMQEQLLAKERELVASQLAGAAAHNLGQPITTIMLQCHLLEKRAQEETAKNALAAIKKECEYMKSVVEKLQQVDPQQTTDYVHGMEILDIESSSPKK